MKIAPRVLVDGFNLALPKGTGVATYGRVLSRTLSSMGFKVNVLYGLNIPRRLNENLQEVMFFNQLAADMRYRRPRLYSPRWWRQTAFNFLGHKAELIRFNNCVEARSFEEHMPTFDCIFNIPFIFQMAAGFFEKTGCFLKIKNTMNQDIVHWTYPLPIKVIGAKNIYTIHDIVPMKMPYTTLDNKIYYYKLMNSLANEADYICTVSEYSKDTIVDFFPKFRNKIFNTYQSTPFTLSDISYERTEREINKLFGISDGGYFIYFGQLEPKKNIGRLLEAFLLSETNRPLVLVGSNGWKEEEELRFLEQGIAMGVIIHIPYVPVKLLRSLIQHARAVLFPSIFEGFGLPILEAFNLKTAVLTSNTGALKEVASDAALLVDPYDVNAIKAGIERLDKDDFLCNLLKDKGKERAVYFDEENYKKRLLEFYSIVLEG
ncbi:glycosyltransferase family 1 protein [Parasaccharibacter sp. TMW 2.1888]|uniref:glycosyltransferase family 4 protein n=1 Tax=Parasaccharibacter sp. TMW 2.1888 TaxID=2268025 RepID=UPI0020522612|nr:glycosyltransferase family 1 protein [Parasaccharibacter sp. TMW 2.1888]UPO80369.1 glycosyltransferase family 1 protein [Parasaccharibacter sp. TMW 2.1888]